MRQHHRPRSCCRTYGARTRPHGHHSRRDYAAAVGIGVFKGVRRLPVVDDNGGLMGILTLDALLELLAEELLDLAKLVKLEQKKETINHH